MTTVSKIILDVRALLDEYTKNGTPLPDDKVADLQASAIRFIDLAQKELYKTGNLYKKYEFTQKNPDNLLGKNAFEIHEFVGEDYYTSEVVARSYYFEADDEGTCVIEELNSGTWVTNTTLTLSSNTKMNAYKGLITPLTVGNKMRLKFTGTTYYKFQNIALFSEPFKASRIPSFKSFVPYSMPSDFRLVDFVVEEYPIGNYVKSSSYKWEGFNEILIDYFYEGTIRVLYKYVPTTITSANDVLEVDDIAALAIVYYVAAKIAPHEMAELTSFFEQKYNELKGEAYMPKPSVEQEIIDIY